MADVHSASCTVIFVLSQSVYVQVRIRTEPKTIHRVIEMAEAPSAEQSGPAGSYRNVCAFPRCGLLVCADKQFQADYSVQQGSQKRKFP